MLPAAQQRTLINVGSLYSKLTSPYVSSYVTSKFAILGFSHCLRQELHDAKDIHVCTVLPEAVDTPIFRHAANYTGRSLRPVPPVVATQRVVRAILRCAKRPRAEITVGQVSRIWVYVDTALPRLYDRIVPYVMGWLGFRDEPAEPGPGNLFEPVHESPQLRRRKAMSAR